MREGDAHGCWGTAEQKSGLSDRAGSQKLSGTRYRSRQERLYAAVEVLANAFYSGAWPGPRQTDLPHIFPASSYYLESVRKEVGEFSQMHPDCIRTSKHSGSLLGRGKLPCRDVTMQGGCAQPPDPSRAGRRVTIKISIDPLQEQSLRRRRIFCVHELKNRFTTPGHNTSAKRFNRRSAQHRR